MPRDARQRYCTERCSDTNLKQRKPRLICKQCRQRYQQSEFRRFCSLGCRKTYLEHHQPGKMSEPIAVLLPLGSLPTRTISGPYVDGQVPQRRVFCRRYERCLSYAESQRWAGFDCSGCDVQEAVIPYLRKPGSNWQP